MVWIDIAILSILALSALLSFFSGFVKEAVSLAALVVAIWAAFAYSSAVAVHMPAFLHSLSFSVGGKNITLPHLDIAAAAALIVLGVLLVGSIISYIATKLIRMAALGGADRVLGVMFGILRGVVIAVLLVTLAGITSLPQSPLWQQSRLVTPFQSGAQWVIAHLPEKYSKEFSYDSAPRTDKLPVPEILMPKPEAKADVKTLAKPEAGDKSTPLVPGQAPIVRKAPSKSP